MESREEFQAHVAGALVAIRLVVTALVKTCPEPEQLLVEIQSLLNTQSKLNGRLPEPIDAAFNEQLHEFTSHLQARIVC
jgi:hypothetical protein